VMKIRERSHRLFRHFSGSENTLLFLELFLRIPVLGMSCRTGFLRGRRSLRDVCTGLADEVHGSSRWSESGWSTPA